MIVSYYTMEEKLVCLKYKRNGLISGKLAHLVDTLDNKILYMVLIPAVIGCIVLFVVVIKEIFKFAYNYKRQHKGKLYLISSYRLLVFASIYFIVAIGNPVSIVMGNEIPRWRIAIIALTKINNMTYDTTCDMTKK
jgi:hypothetical protein